MAGIANAASYTVKPGDNLWNIARQYNTSVARIKAMNNMTSNKLDVGKQIQVPEKSPAVSPATTAQRTIRPVPVAPTTGNVQYAQPDVTSSVTVSRGAVLRRNIVASSFAYIGRPYRYGGTSPKGFDCSGFVGYIFKAAGISLPHNAARQFGKGTAIDKNALIPGDLVFFHTGGSKRINHVGIFIGENRFIHAATGKGISINTLDSKYYSKCYSGARRIIP